VFEVFEISEIVKEICDFSTTGMRVPWNWTSLILREYQLVIDAQL